MSKEDKQKLMKENPLASTNTKKEKEKMVEEQQQVVYEIKSSPKERVIPERRILVSLIN